MDKQTGFSIRKAKQWIFEAEEAYKNIAGAKNIANRATSASAWIVKYPTYTMVVFAGSSSLIDWLIDLSPIPVKYGKGWAHWGMALQHKSIWKRVRAELDPKIPTFFIGHSLGGGLAEISCDFVDDFSSAGFVTYGKPNVWLKSKHGSIAHLDMRLSVVNARDIVATVPRILFGAQEGQQMLYFSKYGGVAHLNPTKRFRKRDRGFLGFRVRRHFIKNYKQRLRNLKLEDIFDRMKEKA